MILLLRPLIQWNEIAVVLLQTSIVKHSFVRKPHRMKKRRTFRVERELEKKLEYFTEGENYDSLRRKHVPLLYKAWSRKREKHHKEERKKTSEERLKSRKIEITFVASTYDT